VLAAAGSGKTHVLLERVVWLCQHDVPPNRIVLTTFTRAAAKELRQRLRERGVARGVKVGTMHALARQWRGLCCWDAPDVESDSKPDFERWLKESAARRKRDKWILVDEAQDLSPEQWDWVRAHARAAFVVGDERQAIYAWRGAKAGGLREWVECTLSLQRSLFDDHDGPAALLVNRRCSAAVVALANALPLDAAPTYALNSGGRLQLQRCISRLEELEAIVRWLDARRGQDVAVLVRTNAEVAWLQSRLRLRGFDVPVMTIHAAKGREWHAVVLALGLRKPCEEDEQATQTWYVAITRAKDELLLTSCGLMPAVLEQAWSQARAAATAAPAAGTDASRGTAASPEAGQPPDAGT
jgi:superfamily I DNA/RNA helicase